MSKRRWARAGLALGVVVLALGVAGGWGGGQGGVAVQGGVDLCGAAQRRRLVAGP